MSDFNSGIGKSFWPTFAVFAAMAFGGAVMAVILILAR